MRATGIPPHLAVVNQINTLNNDFQKLSSLVNTKLNAIESSLSTIIATSVTEEITQNFQIEGVNQITRKNFESLRQELRDSLNLIRSQPPLEVTPIREENVDQLNPENNWWKTWNWNDGRILHFVPPNWKFPTRITTKVLWDLWFFGNFTEGVRPLRLIDRKYDILLNNCNMNYSRAMSVINFIQEIQDNFPDSFPSKIIFNTMTKPQSDEYFMSAWNHVVELLELADSKCKTKDNRIGEKSFGTVSNKINEFKNRENTFQFTKGKKRKRKENST